MGSIELPENGKGGFSQLIEHSGGRRPAVSVTKGFERDERNPPLQDRPRHDIGHDMSCPYVINHTLFDDQTT